MENKLKEIIDELWQININLRRELELLEKDYDTAFLQHIYESQWALEALIEELDDEELIKDLLNKKED